MEVVPELISLDEIYGAHIISDVNSGVRVRPFDRSYGYGHTRQHDLGLSGHTRFHQLHQRTA